jgi:uncharacterized coiled-coil protein SlyX
MLDFSKLLAGLEKGVQFVEEVAPTIAELTPYGAIAETAVKAIGAVTETIHNVAERVNEGEIVANSQDQEQVRALAQRLHDVNDDLARQIDES